MSSSAVFIGMIWLIAMMLLPLFLVRTGTGEPTALLLLTAFVGGNVVFQYPFGRILDRFDNRKFLALCGAMQIAGAALTAWLAAAAAPPLMLAAVLTIWGGFLAGAYTAALTMLGRAFGTEELSGANAAGSLAIEVGGLLGPLLTGALMQQAGPYSMLAVTGLAGFCLVSIALSRRRPPLA